ncbi:hypothetical protein [Kaistia sp. MMO-174]|uniref:hypothetical protein n=1 Tax=Kaistia sp. MMO-174 TaxID=3081256 RepID=UPI00301934E2
MTFEQFLRDRGHHAPSTLVMINKEDDLLLAFFEDDRRTGERPFQKAHFLVLGDQVIELDATDPDCLAKARAKANP